MANESLNNQNLADLSAGSLLDGVRRRINAKSVIINGVPCGAIDSLEDMPGGRRSAGLTAYRTGFHGTHDLDVRSTLLNNRALANEARDRQNSPKLHLVVEHGDRYRGATGNFSLNNLARLVVAITATAADLSKIPLQSTFVADQHKPKLLEVTSTTSFDDLETLKAYDKYIDQAAKNRPKTAKDSANSLLTGLNNLSPEEGFNVESDIAVVASDFLMGPIRDNEGSITCFNWLPALREIHEAIGDRLFIYQLTSPAQRHLAFNTDVSNGDQALSFDTAEYLDMNQRYGANNKQAVVTNVLKGMRLLEVSSIDKRPVMEAADFLMTPVS